MSDKKIKRLTTDNPVTNLESLMNYAYVDNGQVYLRYADGQEHIALAEYIFNIASDKGCHVSSPNAVLDGDCMECDCVVAVLNVVAIQAAELRARLKRYEDVEEKALTTAAKGSVKDEND